MKLKYVIYNDSQPVLFGGYFQHNQVRAGVILVNGRPVGTNTALDVTAKYEKGFWWIENDFDYQGPTW